MIVGKHGVHAALPDAILKVLEPIDQRHHASQIAAVERSQHQLVVRGIVLEMKDVQICQTIL